MADTCPKDIELQRGLLTFNKLSGYLNVESIILRDI